MKEWFKKSLFFPVLVLTVIVMIASSFIQINISYGQAVPLIPIHTGNVTLDKGLPPFYDCIDEKIDNSKGVEEDNYFEKEPTKNEVLTCYNEVFFGNSDVQSSESIEDNDIERFYMLFGNIE